MHGQVVQARQGQRQHYQPIQSQLTNSSQFFDVVDAILQVYAFDCLYIADLNAITGNVVQPNHQAIIQQAIQRYPQISWWVDAGFSQPDILASWLMPGMTPILASESIDHIETYHQLHEMAPHSILSLDFFEEGYRGPTNLLTTPQVWTTPTLVMSLPKVGAKKGPDLEKICELKQRHPQSILYGAGGVRHASDLTALQHAGAEGVLVASALHQRTLQ